MIPLFYLKLNFDQFWNSKHFCSIFWTLSSFEFTNLGAILNSKFHFWLIFNRVNLLKIEIISWLCKQNVQSPNAFCEFEYLNNPTSVSFTFDKCCPLKNFPHMQERNFSYFFIILVINSKCSIYSRPHVYIINSSSKPFICNKF